VDSALDFREDLYNPGVITLELKPGEWTPVCAALDEKGPAEPTPRADPFVMRRADGKPTIIAGYPWFTDWGRDTMISLPGLLISSGRLEEARAVLEMFLEYMSQGVIPNRFPDAGRRATRVQHGGRATLWMFRWFISGSNRRGPYVFVQEPSTRPPKRSSIGTGAAPGTASASIIEDHLLRAGTAGTQLFGWTPRSAIGWSHAPRAGGGSTRCGTARFS
jgi:hypothetical protein